MKAFHNIEPAVDFFDILYGKCYPLFEQSSSHGGYRTVYHVGETASFAHRVGGEQFEVAYRETVYPHIAVFIYSRDACYVCRVFVFREVEVVQYRACGGYAGSHVFDAVAFQ